MNAPRATLVLHRPSGRTGTARTYPGPPNTYVQRVALWGNHTRQIILLTRMMRRACRSMGINRYCGSTCLQSISPMAIRLTSRVSQSPRSLTFSRMGHFAFPLLYGFGMQTSFLNLSKQFVISEMTSFWCLSLNSAEFSE